MEETPVPNVAAFFFVGRSLMNSMEELIMGLARTRR